MKNKEEYLKQIDQVIAQGPYTDSWESLCTHETPKWYRNSKFGIFIHWGVYSVPAFDNEWYARNLYKKNSSVNLFHKEKYGDVSEFGYKDFIPLFRAEKFSPDEWAELFYESGARFVMPVAEHHDGFQMYASDFSKWNSMQMGPQRDILGELKQSVEKKDMVFCASSHRAEHWWFYNTAKSIPDADVHLPEYQDFYGPAHGITRDHQDLFDNPPDEEFMQDWLIRTCEIVDKYQPQIMFFDWWIQQYAFKPYLRKFAAYYYNQAAKWQKEVTIDAKFDAFVYGSATRDIERGQLAEISPVFWQNDTSVAKNSWGYTENNDYKEPQEIICDLIDVVSKNGALLLNVGPKADGTIPQKDREILLKIGKWMKVNSEAIYDTRPWKVYGEGPTVVPEGSFTDTDREAFTSRDIRFTTKGNFIYAFVMKWPEDGKVFIHSLGKNSKYLKSTIRNVEILGQELAPSYNHDRSLEIQADIRADSNPVVLKIEIE